MRNKMLNSIWKDPVFSGVLAAVFGTLLYNVIAAGINKVSIGEAFKNFWTLRLELWIYISLATVSLLIFFIVKKMRRFKYDTETIVLDKELFVEIKSKLLPQDTLIKWLRDHDFGMGFETDNLMKIGKIEEENKNPDFEFFHPEIEKKKRLLVNSIEVFTECMGSYMFGNRNGGINIPSEWEFDQPERFKKALEETGATREAVCKKYDDFVRTGRRILRV
jgi:hypothetical protein